MRIILLNVYPASGCSMWALEILDGLLSDCVTRVGNILFWVALILSLQKVYL